MKLHIGCGNKYLPGYKHLDIIEREHIDYVTNADDLSMIGDETVAEIYACHVLEHFNRNNIRDVLLEWNRVLRPGGMLRIAVPDFEKIVQVYLKNQNLESLLGLLYGGQTYQYNFHFQSYDFQRLETLLLNSGYSDLKRYNWRDFLPSNYDDFSRAYIPHMDFENGILMSLNVVAHKNNM